MILKKKLWQQVDILETTASSLHLPAIEFTSELPRPLKTWAVTLTHDHSASLSTLWYVTNMVEGNLYLNLKKVKLDQGAELNLISTFSLF